MLIGSFSELKAQIQDILIQAQGMSYPISIKIEPYKGKRSGSQNNLYQSITRKMADYTGYSHGEMKMLMQEKHLGKEQFHFMHKGRDIVRERVKGTSGLNKDEYAKFLEQVLGDAAQLDIYPEGDE